MPLPGAGDPRPVMPDTLYLLFPLDCRPGRTCGGKGPVASLSCRFKAVSDWCARIDGGVREPLVGVFPLLRLPSLEASVDFSVLKLALERRRSSRRKDGISVASYLTDGVS